jgi:hypothetical protein
MRHATILAASLAAALLLTAVSATFPHRRRANLRRSAFESAAQPKTASVSAAQPKPVTRKVNSIAAATEAAAAHAGILQGRSKAKVRSVIGSVKGRPGTLGAPLRQTRKNRSAANLRKAIQKATPGVAQTAEALWRKGIGARRRLAAGHHSVFSLNLQSKSRAFDFGVSRHLSNHFCDMHGEHGGRNGRWWVGLGRAWLPHPGR